MAQVMEEVSISEQPSTVGNGDKVNMYTGSDDIVIPEVGSYGENGVILEPEVGGDYEPKGGGGGEPEVVGAGSEPEGDGGSELEGDGGSEPEGGEVGAGSEAEGGEGGEVGGGSGEPEVGGGSEPEGDGGSEPEGDGGSEPEGGEVGAGSEAEGGEVGGGSGEPKVGGGSEPEGDGGSEPEGDGCSEPEGDGGSEPEGDGCSEPEGDEVGGGGVIVDTEVDDSNREAISEPEVDKSTNNDEIAEAVKPVGDSDSDILDLEVGESNGGDEVINPKVSETNTGEISEPKVDKSDCDGEILDPETGESGTTGVGVSSDTGEQERTEGLRYDTDKLDEWSEDVTSDVDDDVSESDGEQLPRRRRRCLSLSSESEHRSDRNENTDDNTGTENSPGVKSSQDGDYVSGSEEIKGEGQFDNQVEGQNESIEGNKDEEEEEVQPSGPMYVPTKGKFFQHDSRSGGENNENDNVVLEDWKTRADWAERWGHDLYVESQQGPKSQVEKERDATYWEERDRRREEGDQGGSRRGGVRLERFVGSEVREKLDEHRNPRSYPQRDDRNRVQRDGQYRGRREGQYTGKESSPHLHGNSDRSPRQHRDNERSPRQQGNNDRSPRQYRKSDHLDEHAISSQNPQHTSSSHPSSSQRSYQTNVQNRQHTDTQRQAHTPPRRQDHPGTQSRNHATHANESKSQNRGGDISGTSGWNKPSSVGQSSADWPTLGKPNVNTQAQWPVKSKPQSITSVSETADGGNMAVLNKNTTGHQEGNPSLRQPHTPGKKSITNEPVDVSASSVQPKIKSLFNTSRQMVSQSAADGGNDVRKTMTFSLSRNREVAARNNSKRGRGRGILKDRPQGAKVGIVVAAKSHDHDTTSSAASLYSSGNDDATSKKVPLTEIEEPASSTIGQFSNNVDSEPSDDKHSKATVENSDVQTTSYKDASADIQKDGESHDFQGGHYLPHFPAGVAAKPKRYSSRRQKTGGGVNEEQVVMDEPSETPGPSVTQAVHPGAILQTNPSTGRSGLLPTPINIPSVADTPRQHIPLATMTASVPEATSHQEILAQQMKDFQMQQEMFVANPEFMNYQSNVVLQQNPAFLQQMQLLWLQQQAYVSQQAMLSGGASMMPAVGDFPPSVYTSQTLPQSHTTHHPQKPVPGASVPGVGGAMIDPTSGAEGFYSTSSGLFVPTFAQQHQRRVPNQSNKPRSQAIPIVPPENQM